jgi:hypothetical protein
MGECEVRKLVDDVSCGLACSRGSSYDEMSTRI